MTEHQNQNPVVTVLGSGSWGTALAILLAGNGHKTRLWGIETDYIKEMVTARVNQRYLPGAHFPENLSLYHDLDQSIHQADDILIAVPSYAFREMIQSLSQKLPATMGISWATKGLDPKSGQLFHQVIKEELDESRNLAVLS